MVEIAEKMVDFHGIIGNQLGKPRRVRCLATTEETIYWGDDGVNMKAMDLKSGTDIA